MLPFPLAEDTTYGMVSIGFVEGSPRSVYIDGSTMYVGLYGALYLFDISIPDSPVFLSSVRVPSIITHMEKVGSVLYAAALDGGLMLFDVSDPMNPRMSGALVSDGKPYRFDIRDSLMLLVDLRNLVILDVSNPFSPSILSSTYLGNLPVDVEVSDNYAFVLSYRNGILVYDISDPTSPAPVSSTSIFGGIHLSLSGNLAFVSRGFSGVDILDISSPDSPSPVGSVGDVYYAYQTIDIDSTLLVCGYTGIWGFDLSSPDSPSPVGMRPLYSTIHMYLRDSILASVDLMGGKVDLLALDSISFLPILSHVSLPGYMLSAEVVGDVAYVISRRQGLLVLDLSAPYLPDIRYRIPDEEMEWAEYRDGLLYVRRMMGMDIWRANLTMEPVLLSRMELGSRVLAMDVENSYAYLALDDGTVLVVDATYPESPVQIATLTLPYPAVYLRVSSGLLVVSDGTGGLFLFDVSDPSSPLPIGEYSPGGYVLSAISSDGEIFLFRVDTGYTSLEVLDRSTLSLLDSIILPSSYRILDMEWNGGKLYTAYEHGSVAMYGYADSLYLETFFFRWGSVSDVDVELPYVYASYGYGGFRVLQRIFFGDDEKDNSRPISFVDRWLQIPAGNSYTIFDISGRKLMEGISSGRVYVEALPPGVYVVKWKGGGFRFMVR